MPSSSSRVTALALATVALPARAQSFLTGSFETIQPGNLRMIGAPTHMFGRDGRPDRTGGAFRLGYGLTGSFDVEGKAAFFDGVTLVGGDGHFRLLDGDTALSLGVGGHQAVMSSGPDSTALDLALGCTRLRAPARPLRRHELLRVRGRATGSDFTRVYLIPGRATRPPSAFLAIEGGREGSTTTAPTTWRPASWRLRRRPRRALAIAAEAA
jgi:hypothetical protein